MIVYNLDAFKEAGVEKGPTTLDELYASAKALSKKTGNTVDHYGLAVGDQDNLIYFFVSLLFMPMAVRFSTRMKARLRSIMMLASRRPHIFVHCREKVSSPRMYPRMACGVVCSQAALG